MIFYLDASLQKYFDVTTPLFDQLMALQGEQFRNQDGRVTQKVFIGNRAYFIKQHFGVGYGEIFKNLLQFRLPIISAKNEWQALQACADIKIATAKLVGFGERGLNPAKRQSFVLMEALLPSISLEELCDNWLATPPSFSRKIKYLKMVAKVAKKFHQHGLHHRDFYLCHFLLHGTSEREQLHLIDLHRASSRMGLRNRWTIKDLAGLYFSAQDIGLTQRDYLRFMKMYSHKSLREIINTESYFWQRVKKRGELLYHEHHA